MAAGSDLCLIAGSANPGLGRSVAAAAGVDLQPAALARFPDGELRPAAPGVRGKDVYVIQPTAPPVNDSIFELMLWLDACRRGGARRLTAVVPYFGYARQDRRSRAGEAVGAAIAARAIAMAGADRVVVVDPHTPALEAMSPVPMDAVSAVPLLGERVAAAIAPSGGVVVAPDLGAVKLAERYAGLSGVAVAVVRKVRESATAVRARELVGAVEGKVAVIVDDMISTGGTVEAAARLVIERGAKPPVLVAATHGLLVTGAIDRLRSAGVERVVVTDTVAGVRQVPGVEICSVAALLATVIDRLHGEEGIDSAAIY